MLKDLTGLKKANRKGKKNLGLIHSVHDLDIITVLGLQGADVVFHFAANPEVRISSVRPRVHFDENVVATFNILDAARRFNVEALVLVETYHRLYDLKTLILRYANIVDLRLTHGVIVDFIRKLKHQMSGAHGLTSDSLSLPAGSHLNLHRPLPNDSTTSSSSSANMSFIRGSSARGDTTMSVATVL